MKTKKITLFLGMLLFVQAIFAQIPAGYYDSATGTGAALKSALHKIIRNHTKRSYTQLWTDFETTDAKTGGGVWDMYSNCSFVFGTNQCGNYSAECDCYNREHSMPNSWWGGVTSDTSYTDLFHLVPTDGKVNGMRSNNPFGVVTSPTYTSGNGSKLGPCTFPGYTGTVFEPVDEYKGDFARNYLYMATRYETRIGTWTSDMLAGNSYPVFTTWAVNLLLQWNAQDTVSQKEIDRNNAIYGIQHNRNPFIDHPEWANVIWGTPVAVTAITVNSAGNATTISTPQGTLQMSAVITPSNASNQTVTWSVIAGTGTASINASGLLTAATNGTVTVKATANDGSGVSGTKEITLSNQGTGIDSYTAGGNYKFFPNPVDDLLTVDLSLNSTLPELIWISDVTGKLVYQIVPTELSTKIDLSSFNHGLYFLNINSKQAKSTYKIAH
jgi:endonuclease I